MSFHTDGSTLIKWLMDQIIGLRIKPKEILSWKMSSCEKHFSSLQSY